MNIYNFLLIIFCLMLYVFISYYIHYRAYVQNVKTGDNSLYSYRNYSFVDLFYFFRKSPKKKMLVYFFSIDFYFADFFKMTYAICMKEKSTNKSVNLKKYIQDLNKVNIRITLISFFTCYIHYLIEILNNGWKYFLFQKIDQIIVISFFQNLNLVNVLSLIMFALLIIRTISRAFEIMFAFFIDISQYTKSSTLKSNERIKLAIISYFEIILNFALIYSIFEKLSILKCSVISIFNVGSLNSIFYSFGITTFTGVHFEGNTLLLNCFTVLQLLSSMCLVYFALAKYIGEQQADALEKYEKENTKSC